MSNLMKVWRPHGTEVAWRVPWNGPARDEQRTVPEPARVPAARTDRGESEASAQPPEQTQLPPYSDLPGSSHLRNRSRLLALWRKCDLHGALAPAPGAVIQLRELRGRPPEIGQHATQRFRALHLYHRS